MYQTENTWVSIVWPSFRCVWLCLHGHFVYFISLPPTLYQCTCSIESWDHATQSKGKIIDMKLFLHCAHLLQLKVAANYLLTVNETRLDNCHSFIVQCLCMYMYYMYKYCKFDRRKNKKERGGGLRRQTSSHFFLTPNIMNHTFVWWVDKSIENMVTNFVYIGHSH